MRSVLFCATLAVSFVVAMAATTPRGTPKGLTVVMDFKGAHSEPSIREMERESGTILKSTGLKLDWRLRNQTDGETYRELVVMTFNGTCKFDRNVRAYNPRGPLASTRTTDHVIQPFGQVDCDHVVSTARSAMFGGDFARGDMLVGRALGRVVVHELIHMLTKSRDHAREGVFEAGLSGKQLIAAELPLNAIGVNLLMPGYESEQQ